MIEIIGWIIFSIFALFFSLVLGVLFIHSVIATCSWIIEALEGKKK